MRIGSALTTLMAVPGRLEDKNLQGQEHYACGLLRDIRVHTQDAQNSVDEIKTAIGVIDPLARAKEMAQTLEKNQVAFERNKKNVYELLTRIRKLFDERRDLYDDYGDEVSQVADLWERVIQAWPSQQDSPEMLARKVPEIENWLQRIIWHCGFVTIPPRLNEHLKGMRVGQTLDFHTNFVDELPDKKDRDEMLRYLKDHPLYIDGITDAENGLIYRASHDARVRAMSFVRIGLMLLGGVLLVWFISYAGRWLKLTEWPVSPDQLKDFLVAYLFVLLGSSLHVLIAAFKQARSGKEQPFTALEDLVLWVHVKELPIMGGILSVWLGLFGMAFMGKIPVWQTAIFVGYGIDSIVDVVLQRFEATVPKKQIEI